MPTGRIKRSERSIPVKQYFVYIATNRTRTLYTGFTDDLRHREWQHETGRSIFTAKYRIDHVVYYEEFSNAKLAVAREKEIKGWRRSKKIALIESLNPNWKDGSKPWLP